MADFESIEVFHYSIPSIQETGDGVIQNGSDIESDKISLDGGELIVSKLNPRKGCVLLTRPQSVPIVCSTEFVPLVAKPGYDSRFAFYVYTSTPIREFISSLVQSVTKSHQRANPEDITKVWIPVPPLLEQQAITNYLDRETAQIDYLVEKKTLFIDLLDQKSQTITTNAVTKGINPKAKMKPSGVEWLGDVPAHWVIGPIKRWFTTVSGGTPDTAQQEKYYATAGGTPWIRTTDLNNGVVDTHAVAITQDAIADTACKVLPVESILIAMYGGGGTIGKNGLLAIPACINQAICALLPSEAFDLDFAFAYIQFYRPHWMVDAVSTRKDPNISQELIRSAPILLPPIDEQREIAKHIRQQSEHINLLRNKTQESIALLKERRTALITAAVTGQIDLRKDIA